MTRNITINESIKQEIAEKVVEQSSAGYSHDAQGSWYVVDGERVVHAQARRPWNPWSDDADVIGVEDLVNIYGGAEADRALFWDDREGNEQYDAQVDFALSYVPDSYDADDYSDRRGH